MSTPSITEASSITADSVLELGKFYSAQELRKVQSKLTNTGNEILKITGHSGKPCLEARVGACLSFEQSALLKDAAKLIFSINSKIEHAKEKRKRSEAETKRRQDARNAQAKKLVAESFILPSDQLDQVVEMLKTLLHYNRAKCFQFTDPVPFNSRLRNYLSPENTRTLINTPTQTYWLRVAQSLYQDLLDHVARDVAYDDGSSVEERLTTLKRQVADEVSRVALTVHEEQTLRQWKEALFPDREKQEGQA